MHNASTVGRQLQERSEELSVVTSVPVSSNVALGGRLMRCCGVVMVSAAGPACVQTPPWHDQGTLNKTCALAERNPCGSSGTRSVDLVLLGGLVIPGDLNEKPPGSTKQRAYKIRVVVSHLASSRAWPLCPRRNPHSGRPWPRGPSPAPTARSSAQHIHEHTTVYISDWGGLWRVLASKP